MFKKKRKTSFNGNDIVVGENKFSSIQESYERLKDNIMYLNIDGNTKVLQVESSVAHEGKTTTVCNLAVSLGLTNKKVVVVDLDFRKPRIQQALSVSIENGIAEYMKGNSTLDDIIKHTGYKNVDVITRGEKIYNPAVILISQKFKQMIEELKSKYDYVLLDCAPILQVSDYIFISQISDGVIFICAYNQTTKAQVSDAIKELNKNDVKILGNVLTMYDASEDSAYRYAYYKNYYSEAVLNEQNSEKKENK